MTASAILDIILAATVLIAIIIGAVKGFAKQFTGFFSTIGALVGALFLSMFITELLLKSPAIFNLTFTFSNLVSKIEGTQVTITTLEELNNVLSSGALIIFKTSAEKILPQMQALSFTTVGQYLGYQILKIVMEIVLYIVFYLCIAYFFKGVRAILEKINGVDFFKLLDRLFGIAWSLFMTYIIVAGILLTGVELLLTTYVQIYLNGCMELISQSYILTFLHNTNFIGAYISDFVGIQLPAISPAAASLSELNSALAFNFIVNIH